MLEVLTIVGTRPELIRLSRVIARLDATVNHVHVHVHVHVLVHNARTTIW